MARRKYFETVEGAHVPVVVDLTAGEIADRDQQALDAAAEDRARDVAQSFAPGTARRAVALVLFDQENRLRALEGKAPVTLAQFRAAFVALMEG